MTQIDMIQIDMTQIDIVQIGMVQIDRPASQRFENTRCTDQRGLGLV